MQQSTVVTCCLLALTFCLVVVAQENDDNSQIAAKIFKPLVEVGPSKESDIGRHVGVHVPLYYNMEMDTRPGEGSPNFYASILSGFVKVRVNRKKGADGKLRGPIKVTVFGIPMYNNFEKEPE